MPDVKDARAAASLLLPFTLVLYLGLRGGGYETTTHGEIGLIAWSAILILSLTGMLNLSRLDRTAWIALGLLAAFTGWTALGLLWTESAERTIEELVRVGTYLAIFAIAVAARRKSRLRQAVVAVGAAIGVLGALALLSRLHPGWFPPDDLALAQPDMAERLNYPLNYWNGVAALLAMGIPLLIAISVDARTRIGRALAAASLPALALAIFFTFSRGSLVLVALGVFVMLVLHPRRIQISFTAVAAGLGSGVLVFFASKRTSLMDGLADDAAWRQGDEMIPIVLLICALVALAITTMQAQNWADRIRMPALTNRGRRRAVLAGIAGLVVAAVALTLSGEIEESWREFKMGGSTGSGTERFQATGGNGRYQYWDSALGALGENPLTGTGPGTFELWWTRTATLPGPVNDAHSVYFESLAETGILGALLLIAFMVTVLIAAARGVLRVGSGEGAAALAGLGIFAFGAGFDWFWEIPVLPVSFLLLAASSLARPEVDGISPAGGRAGLLERTTCAAVAVAGIAVTGLVVAETRLVQDSQAAVRAERLELALSRAEAASSVAPWAVNPVIQKALVLRESNELDAASAAAKEAVGKEPTNWQLWLILAEIEHEVGRYAASVDAYRKTRMLNPVSGNILYIDDLISKSSR